MRLIVMMGFLGVCEVTIFNECVVSLMFSARLT